MVAAYNTVRQNGMEDVIIKGIVHKSVLYHWDFRKVVPLVLVMSLLALLTMIVRVCGTYYVVVNHHRMECTYCSNSFRLANISSSSSFYHDLTAILIISS